MWFTKCIEIYLGFFGLVVRGGVRGIVGLKVF